MKKNFLAGLATGLFLVGMTGLAKADLIVNGSFEAPAIGGWSVFSSIPGWQTVAGSGIEIQNNAAGSPYDGLQHVELDSYNNSAMEQLVNTVSGQAYTLSFAYSPRPGVPSNSNDIDVYWNYNLLASMTGYTGGNTSWSVQNFTVLGVGSSTSLIFSAGGVNDSLGGYIDAVSLEPTGAPVPEPATMLLFGTGLVGLASVSRRRKK